MKIFEISSSLSENATIMLLGFLDEICIEMRSFMQAKSLSSDSRVAVNNCWLALKYLVLHTSTQVKIDRGISPDYYDSQRKLLDSLGEVQTALFWSFMFRGTEYMMKKIKSPQYISNSDYVEVKKQLLAWHNFARKQYLPLREFLKSLKPVISQSYSYTEPGSFVPSLGQ